MEPLELNQAIMVTMMELNLVEKVALMNLVEKVALMNLVEKVALMAWQAQRGYATLIECRVWEIGLGIYGVDDHSDCQESVIAKYINNFYKKKKK